MRPRPILAAALLAVSVAAAGEARDSVKGGDARLVRSVRAVDERIAGIVQSARTSGLVAVRADRATRSAEAMDRSRRLLPPDRAGARGRAWRDLGLGGGSEPADLVAAIEGDLEGMTIDAGGLRLLVDPQRLPDEVVRGDPDVDPDASVVLATGVAPDELIAAHYLAHGLLDGAPLDGATTTDALLSRAALAEGSANLAALVLLFGGVGLEAEVLSGALHPEDALGGRLIPEAMRSAGPVVAHLLEFVYLDGFAQASALARKGGFQRLARERLGLRTTRDVMHLDRTPTASVDLSEPALPAALGLSVVDRDSLGEQGIVALVSLLTGKDNLGLIAGDGWVGDALWRFESATPSAAPRDDGVSMWVTVFATEGDANDFAYAWERCLVARFPGESLAADGAHGGRVLRRGDRIYRVEKIGTRVIVRVSTPTSDLDPSPGSKKKAPTRPTPRSKK